MKPQKTNQDSLKGLLIVTAIALTILITYVKYFR